MPTGRHHKESKRPNSIFEFDLKTGKNKGRLAVAEAAQQIVPLRMSGERLLALQVGYESKAAAKVYRIDPATGEKYPLLTTVVSNPDITGLMDLTSLRSKPLFEHGRLLFSRTECEGPTRPTGGKSDVQSGDQLLGVAFGAA